MPKVPQLMVIHVTTNNGPYMIGPFDNQDDAALWIKSQQRSNLAGYGTYFTILNNPYSVKHELAFLKGE